MRLVLVALPLLGMVVYPAWGRIPFSRPMVDVRLPALPPDSLVVLSSVHALGYAVAFLPDDVPAVSISNNFMHPQNCTRLQAEAERRIRGHRGPLWLLRLEQAGNDFRASAISLYGLAEQDQCVKVATNIDPLVLCRLERHPAPVRCVSPR